MKAIAQHFACEAPGYVPGKCDQAVYQQYYSYWWLSDITDILIGLFPAVNLVFVINFQETQKRLSTFWLRVMNFLGSCIDYDQSDQQH